MSVRAPMLAVFAGAIACKVSAGPQAEGTVPPQPPQAQSVPETVQSAPVSEQEVPPAAPPAAAPPATAPLGSAPAAAPPEEPEAKTDAVPSAQPEAPSQKAAPTLKNVESVAPNEAFSVLGKKVHGADGKDVLGAIIDILVDDQGRPRAAIVDFGGFLGVGSRKIAVDWQLLKFHPNDSAVPIVLDLDRKQIQAAPEYKDPTRPAEVVEPTAAGTPAQPSPDERAAPVEAVPPQTSLPQTSLPQTPPPGTMHPETDQAPSSPARTPAPPDGTAAPAGPSPNATAQPNADKRQD